MQEITVKTKGVWYGVMAYWTEVKDAACYIVRLYIGTKQERIDKNGRKLPDKITYQELACIEKDRNFKFHTFEGLGRINEIYNTSTHSWCSTNNSYYVSVEAENRTGEIIAKAEPISASIIFR